MSSIGRHVVRTAAIAAFLLSYQVLAHGQNQISGQVLGLNNRPVPDVYVELYNDVNRLVMRGRTNGSGHFFFRGMGTGRFNVVVKPFGTEYEDQTQEVQISNLSIGPISASDSQQATFYLRTRRGAAENGSRTGVVFAQEIPKDAKISYEKAVVDLEADRVLLGITELENALTVFPDYFLANDRLGVEMLKQQKYDDARRRFQKAVDVNAKASNSWYGLAYASYALDMTADAIDAAKKAATLSPDAPEMLLMLGISLRRGKQYPEAETALLKAKKLTNGKSADASWNLALLYVYNLRKFRLAADELENYLKIKPDHPDAEKLRKLIRQYREA